MQLLARLLLDHQHVHDEGGATPVHPAPREIPPIHQAKDTAFVVTASLQRPSLSIVGGAPVPNRVEQLCSCPRRRPPRTG